MEFGFVCSESDQIFFETRIRIEVFFLQIPDPDQTRAPGSGTLVHGYLRITAGRLSGRADGFVRVQQRLRRLFLSYCVAVIHGFLDINLHVHHHH